MQLEYKQLSATEIGQLRRDLGWTQTVMGQYLKVATRTVAYWESGETSPSEYQMAALQFLHTRLTQARKRKREDTFRKELNEQLPAILFGIGIAALFVFLLTRED